MYPPRSRHIFAVVALCFAVGASACEGCAGCGEPVESAPDTSAPTPSEPDAAPVADEGPNLAVATELAEAEAEKISVLTGDSARAVAGAIEATKTKAPKPPKPRIKDEPETGKLAKAALNKVFNLHADAMKSCYERSLKRTPGLAGKVRLTISIRSNGSVQRADARGLSLRDANVQKCMERQALTMKFEEPEGGAVRVNKTYSFAPDF